MEKNAIQKKSKRNGHATKALAIATIYLILCLPITIATENSPILIKPNKDTVVSKDQVFEWTNENFEKFKLQIGQEQNLDSGKAYNIGRWTKENTAPIKKYWKKVENLYKTDEDHTLWWRIKAKGNGKGYSYSKSQSFSINPKEEGYTVYIIIDPNKNKIHENIASSYKSQSSSCSFQYSEETMSCQSKWSSYRTCLKNSKITAKVEYEFTDCKTGESLATGILCNGECSPYIKRPKNHKIKINSKTLKCQNGCKGRNTNCSNKCNQGEKRCHGLYEQTCGDYDFDGCLEWPTSTSGNGSKKCINKCSKGTCDSSSNCHKGKKGESKYCSKTCKCNTGEGDCDSDNECNPGLFCARNVGKNYGWSKGTDVCEDNSPGNLSCHKDIPGEFGYCSSECKCDTGQGDCDNDSECKTGLKCVYNVGANYGWNSGIDVCETTGNNNTCTIPDGSNWECECDYDKDCPKGYYCLQQSGADPCKPTEGKNECKQEETRCKGSYKQTCGNYDTDRFLEWPTGTNGKGNNYCSNGCNNGTCKINQDCHQGKKGGWSYCSKECPCNTGEGDCDSDNECKTGLKCIKNTGTRYGWSLSVDVCEKPGSLSSQTGWKCKNSKTVAYKLSDGGYVNGIDCIFGCSNDNCNTPINVIQKATNSSTVNSSKKTPWSTNTRKKDTKFIPLQINVDAFASALMTFFVLAAITPQYFILQENIVIEYTPPFEINLLEWPLYDKWVKEDDYIKDHWNKHKNEFINKFPYIYSWSDYKEKCIKEMNNNKRERYSEINRSGLVTYSYFNKLYVVGDEYGRVITCHIMGHKEFNKMMRQGKIKPFYSLPGFFAFI